MLRTRQFSKMYENWRISTGDRLWRSLLGESSSFSPAKWNKIVCLWGIPTVMALYQLKVSSNHIYGMLTPFMSIYNWQLAKDDLMRATHTKHHPFPPASHGGSPPVWRKRNSAHRDHSHSSFFRIFGSWNLEGHILELYTFWSFIKQNFYIYIYSC